MSTWTANEIAEAAAEAEIPDSKLEALLCALETNTARIPTAVPLCSICRSPQFNTPHGLVCKNGHGGVESLDPT